MVALGVASYANNVYNNKFSPTGYLDVKPLLFAGISALFLEAFAAAIGDEAATMLGWTAFVAMLIAPIQKPSPLDNILSLGKVK
jgi:hypothetical protein